MTPAVHNFASRRTPSRRSPPTAAKKLPRNIRQRDADIIQDLRPDAEGAEGAAGGGKASGGCCGGGKKA